MSSGVVGTGPQKGHDTKGYPPHEGNWGQGYPPWEGIWDQGYPPSGRDMGPGIPIPPVERQTPAKTLPSPTSLAGGKNVANITVNVHTFQHKSTQIVNESLLHHLFVLLKPELP